jgi:hypothetical protein
MPKYTQTFASLASQFKTQDDGVNFTITVDADNRKQAARRLAILLYGRCAVASSELTTVRPALGPMQIKSLTPSNPTPECPGCGAAAGMELCHCKSGCTCARCAKKKSGHDERIARKRVARRRVKLLPNKRICPVDACCGGYCAACIRKYGY